MHSLTLAELQNTLQQYLLHQQNNIDSLTLETAAFTRQQRLAIYFDAYRLRLIDALHNDFPALEMTLGTENFSQLMAEYIAQHPSQHPSLRWMGAKLPMFLRTYQTAQQPSAIFELAEFEWAQIMAFDADDSIPATLDDLRLLKNTQWLDLQLEFQPSLQIVSCFSNAPNIWNAAIKNESRIAIETSSEEKTWLIWRSELQVVYRVMNQSETWCLQAFSNHKNFADACEGLCEWFPEDQVPLKAAQYLQQWLQDGLIKSIIASPIENSH